ncbi:MAG TPA: hypothetical protein VFG87_20950 [Amycolatopsis sp.]|nr:hypothetical protein [Amycolatopsis sp.]
MCDKDGPPEPLGRTTPRTKEFAKLGLPDLEPFHCDDCRHVVKGSTLPVIGAGAVLAAVGIAVMFGSVSSGLVMFLVGAGIAGFGYFFDRRRKEDAARFRPPLPVVPHIDSATIRETVRGRLTLDQQGTYTTSLDPVEGALSVAMTFGRPDQDRLRSYRDKYQISGHDVEFSAGFAVLVGEAGVRFEGTRFPGGVIPLSGRVVDQPFLATPDARTGAHWRFEAKHRLRKTGIDSLPLWLTPSLEPESDQRTVNLELQWVAFGPAEEPLEIDQLGPLTVRVPVSWGNVESATQGGNMGIEEDPDNPGEMVRVLEWRRPSVGDDDKRRRRITLVIRFENRISMDEEIRGSVEATFKGSLSGLHALQIHHPLGGKRTDYRRRTARTRVTAEFGLSLAGLRYQDVRMVPDRNRNEDANRNETDPFPGVIPDHETVIALTNLMSDDGYYVKRIIENPPRTGGRADIVNRYWDIAGRYYDGVYPVDFNLSLTGEEIYHHDIRPEAGNTKVRLSVRGAYANAEMERAIEQRWDALHALTAETLKRRSRTTTRMSPDTPAENLVPPQRNFGEPSGPQVTAEPARPETLSKKLDQLTEALLAGRISEDTYRQISARIERELGGE